jgi:hypothetical protein
MCKEKNHNIRDKLIPKPQLMVNPRKAHNLPNSPLLTPFDLAVQQFMKFAGFFGVLGVITIYTIA